MLRIMVDGENRRHVVMAALCFQLRLPAHRNYFMQLDSVYGWG